jgi:hypothetical protein
MRTAAQVVGVMMLAAASFSVDAATSGGQAGSAVYTCVNPVSGAAWRISVDYRRATVDANPAKISETEMSWFDPSDSSYNTLNRETGRLTSSVASSTGGYFRYARCRLNAAH